MITAPIANMSIATAISTTRSDKPDASTRLSFTVRRKKSRVAALLREPRLFHQLAMIGVVFLEEFLEIGAGEEGLFERVTLDVFLPLGRGHHFPHEVGVEGGLLLGRARRQEERAQHLI